MFWILLFIALFPYMLLETVLWLIMLFQKPYKVYVEKYCTWYWKTMNKEEICKKYFKIPYFIILFILYIIFGFGLNLIF